MLIHKAETSLANYEIIQEKQFRNIQYVAAAMF